MVNAKDDGWHAHVTSLILELAWTGYYGFTRQLIKKIGLSMAVAEAEQGALPVVPWLKQDDEGPYLEGHRCGNCGAVYLGERDNCSSCGARSGISPEKLTTRGTLYSYSIVHRSFPGVEVPYVSAIVDLEGGGTIKGNLIDVEPDPAKLVFDMPVEVVFRDALGRKDDEGNAYVSYFFKPI